MAHLETLEGLQISNEALDFVSESFAREHSLLPVSVTSETLYLIVPSSNPLAEGNTFLESMSRRRLRIDTADAALLENAVDLHYRARSAKVVNCEPVFRFRCPNRWASLDSTEKADVRYCNECGQRVYLCRSNNEIAVHVEQRHCVAFAPPAANEPREFVLGLVGDSNSWIFNPEM